MAGVDPTPATFKARFPKFAAVDNAVVQEAIDEAGRRVDATWPDADYTLAKSLYAAHVLTMDGLGTGGEAEIINLAGVGLKRVKAGDKEMEFTGTGGAGSSSANVLGLTTYGVRFRDMQRRLFSGPRVTGQNPIAPGTSWPW